MIALIRAMRPRQWIKNLLVIAAPLAAGVILQPRVLLLTGLALVAFICVSSATYLINDVRDREVDRAHPTKHQRPIAAGAVSTRTAVIAAVVLIIIGLGVAAIAGLGLVVVVLGYLAATLTYSFGLKHEPVIELGLLATGFLLRAIAGGVAADLPLSPWFLLVTGFGSLAVAAGKRYSELITLNGDTDTPQRRSLAGYTPTYLRFVWTLAAAVAVTTYCLWVVEVGQPDSTAPWALISVIPFVLAFLRFGVDLDAGRTQAPEDAVLGDPILLVLGLAWVVTFGAGALGI
jgi:decaprenyl-phosphate phosphoribosyltransferase